ncbi:NADP-specific glutamate dehydrogenase [Aliikangiella maris]|uniref:NADP-specific glutamate dehydrogenase n=2 Tax=Aliikangiella maris TaxID=3162458 RepID=A0ABV3MUH4_9GAMM
MSKTLIDLNEFMDDVKKHNPGEPEFHQAVLEVAEDIIPFVNEHPQYNRAAILRRMIEPDRIVSFRVCWEDDQGHIQVNRGYRVQYNNAIGPYKGGLRFHPTVNQSILKFLGFEQVFKNSLTTLPMGGGKGGADFDPKGKSDREVMRFCQSFMTELHKHIGPNRDIPAGDIGVGAREIGYLFGQYKRLENEFTGTLTGKSLEYGGSLIRTEATGYGVVYFIDLMLKQQRDSLADKTVVISGSGNVAQYAAQKVIQLGGKVVTMSDSSGFIYDPDGIDADKLAYIVELKTVKRGRIKEYADKYGCEYFADEKPWGINCDVAIPCATQNEIDVNDAKLLVANGVKAIAEGANMPTGIDAIHVFHENKILYAPGKASNAGGVAVSGLEMTQNSLRLSWSRTELDDKLQGIMASIHEQCLRYSGGAEGEYIDYVKGANIAGFVKVANAMLAYGVV